ncbi:MAG TPA: sulfate permease [Actinomycetota bacterium]|nr:sulfate permease [Actinomycetota bacterium]
MGDPAGRGGIAAIAPGVALLRVYRRPWLRPDLLAALSLWAVLVPQALAYGQLAGLPPVTGLYTALGAMLLYVLFGTSRYLNLGPESSVAILVASSLAPLAGADPDRYAALAALLALLVGALLLLGRLARLGVITRLLSAPVLTGYLAGSAIVIVGGQLTKITGIDLEDSSWPTVLGGLLQNLEQTNLWALGFAVGTALVVLLVARFAPRLPAPLVAVLLATAAVSVFGLADRLDVVGSIDTGVPVPALPDAGVRDALDLLGPAASVALLVFSGSVLTGRSLAARDREDLDANREFVGLGAANLAAGLLQGFPANASDSRSFVAANAGGRSQMTGLIGAGLVLVTLLALIPLFRNLPNAALGAVIILTAIRLVDLRELRRLWRVRRSDFVLALITFAGVLVFGVLGGIGVGVLASLLEVMRRAVLPHTAVLGMVAGTATYRDVEQYADAETLPGLVVYRFDAPVFFANADVFRDQIRELMRDAKVPVREVIVNAEGINDLDTTGIQMLERLLDDLEDQDVHLSWARVRTPLRNLMRSTGLEQRIGAGNFHLRVEDAVAAFSRRRG